MKGKSSEETTVASSSQSNEEGDKTAPKSRKDSSEDEGTESTTLGGTATATLESTKEDTSKRTNSSRSSLSAVDELCNRCNSADSSMLVFKKRKIFLKNCVEIGGAGGPMTCLSPFLGDDGCSVGLCGKVMKCKDIFDVTKDGNHGLVYLT